MSIENNEQLVEQLLNGISRLCGGRDDCNGCPFFSEKCVFDEPKPKTWFVDEKPADEEASKTEEPVIEEAKPSSEEKPAAPQPQETKEDGTWLVSTTMGSVFTKYVYICSKCGYRKESYLSLAPTAFCPECEKRKLQKD